MHPRQHALCHAQPKGYRGMPTSSRPSTASKHSSTSSATSTASGTLCRAQTLDGRRARQTLAPRCVAKAIDHILTRWQAFTRFLNDGMICLSNNAADAPYAVWLWAESRGYSPNRSAGAERHPYVNAHPPSELNDVDPQVWLADVLLGSPIIS